MQLDILSPEKKVYSGTVYGIMLPGMEGTFELLENHAPIISALKKGRIKILKDKNGNTENYDITGGFVEMLHNKASVLVEGAKLAD